MFKRYSFLCLFVCAIGNGSVQAQDASEIFHGLKKLEVYGSVLYIAAHPDDENTRLLSYLANEKQYRTAYLSLTRGDGGQNLIGDEQGIDLGLIRTQELLDARKIDGAQQFFTRAYDFGYSKSPDEAFNFWGHNEILADVVWVIRKFKPDVIITRFPTTGEGGHGHHTASAILASEAFDAAADEKMFPEQFAFGVKPWQAKRLLWNTFNFGTTNTQSEDQFKIDVGMYNSVLGIGYGEMAAKSRSMHRSQGFGVAPQRGQLMEYFKTLKGEPPVNNLMDGISTDLSRLKGVEAGDRTRLFDMQRSPQLSFNIQHPSESISSLLQLKTVYANFLPAVDSFWKDEKMQAVDRLTKKASGIYMEVNASNQFNVAGDSMQLIFSFNNRLGLPVSNVKMQVLNVEAGWADAPLNEQKVVKKWTPVSNKTHFSTPFFLQKEKGSGRYNIEPIPIRNLPEIREFEAKVSFDIYGRSVKFSLPVSYKFTDPVKGEVHQPVFIVQRAEVSFDKDVLLIKPQDEIKEAKIKVKFNAPVNERVRVYAGEKNKLQLIADTVVDVNKGDEMLFPLQVKYLKDKTRLYYAEVELVNHKERFQLATHLISYDHIPNQLYHYKDSLKVISPELTAVGRKIGYIAGAGDKVPEALEQMGYRVDMLSREQLLSGTLNEYDAIVAGVRAYNVHSWLASAYKPLMLYVEQGGVLIVQYNTQNNIGGIKFDFAPYPFTISRSRITNENAPVSMLQPEHRIWNYPNKINLHDFDGWIQERSIYSAEDIDKAYTRLIAMKDPWPGDKVQDGSLIVANYGKGRFIYTGLVLFRELPAGVPGAYRILANLLAH